jgi:DNA-binding transcriptional LysR family regulator
MDVSFELYKIFYHCGKNLNYSLTAKELYVSQSSISQSIRTLEKQLNTKLFFRSGKGVSLTEEGKNLFYHIEKAYNIIKIGEKNLENLLSLELGTIKIGASDTVCKYFILPQIKEFHKNYPKVNITINNRPSSISLEMIEKGLLDVGIININPNIYSQVYEIIKFNSFQSVFIASPEDFGYLKNKKISLKELEGLPAIFLEKNSTTRKIFDSFIEELGINIVPEFEFGSMDLIIEMTKNNMGIGIVPEVVAAPFIKSGDVFKINIIEKLPEIDIGIVYNKSVPLSIATEKFIEILKKR